MKALLTIAAQVQESGKSVTGKSITSAKEAGATDIEIHDTVLIAGLQKGIWILICIND